MLTFRALSILVILVGATLAVPVLAAESSVYSTTEKRDAALKPGAKPNNHAYDAMGNGSTPRAADTAVHDLDTSTKHNAMTATDEKLGGRAIDSANQQVIEKGQKVERKNELGSQQDPALRQQNVKDQK